MATPVTGAAVPLRGESQLELGGRAFVLHFGYGEICELEKAHQGKALASIYFSGTPADSAILEALRVGLAKRFRRMTLAEITKWIDAEVDKDPKSYDRVVMAVLLGLLSAKGATPETLDRVRSAADAEDGGEVAGPEPLPGSDQAADGPRPTTAPTTGGG